MKGYLTNKKLGFLILLMFMALTVSITHAQTRFGIRLGINASNVTEKDKGGNESNTQNMPGVVVGLTVQINLMKDFYFQPALLYSRKGFKQESDGFYGSATNFQVKTDYIELPVNLLYKPKLGMGRLIFGAGPYIAYGTGGNWKSDTDILIGDIRMKGEGQVEFRNDGSVRNDSEYTFGRPLDYGFNAAFGYELRERLSLQVTGMVGIANLEPHFDGYQSGRSLRNKGFGISLGYIF